MHPEGGFTTDLDLRCRAMPRRARNQLPADGIYHVTVRGVDRCLIVRDDCNWRALHELVLAAQGKQFGSAYDAYCLMSSHFHCWCERRSGASRLECTGSTGPMRSGSIA